jgi:hypothetical protein
LIIRGDREPRDNSARTSPETSPASHLGLMPELSVVRILNPLPGGAQFLSHRHALRYVKQRRAEWAGSKTIRFIERDHRHQSAGRLARIQTAAGYDGRGMLRLDEIKRLPCIDAVRLIAGRKCLA